MTGRTPARRFEAKAETVQRELVTLMKKLGATNVRIEQDLMTGEAIIRFDRRGTRYIFTSTQYKNTLDNLRAAQLTIDYLWRALEHYGVTQSKATLDQAFATVFLGFEVAPDDTTLLLGDGSNDWWVILGVDKTADRTTIINAYRALAKRHHPDAGGNPDDFKRLRTAYEAAMGKT